MAEEKCSYELCYFPLRGRAEVIRLLFALASQPFEDTIVEYRDWPTMKAESDPLMGDFASLPILKVTKGGKTVEIPQSYSIARFVARQLDLMPSDPFEAAQADVVCECVLDLRLGYFNPVFYAPAMGKNAKAVSEYMGSIDEWLGLLVRLMERRGQNGYFAAANVCYADIVVWDTLDLHILIRPDILSKFPALQTFYDKVKALPALRNYLKNRRAVDPSIAAQQKL